MIVTFAGYDIKVGTPVVSRDGAEVGTVDSTIGEDLVVNVTNSGSQMLLTESGVAAFEPDFIRLGKTAADVAAGDYAKVGEPPAAAPAPSAPATAAPAPAHVVEPEPVAVPEPTAIPEPAAASEPVATPEPVAAPEPARSPEPAAVAEPAAPEPVAVPEPEPAPAPVGLLAGKDEPAAAETPAAAVDTAAEATPEPAQSAAATGTPAPGGQTIHLHAEDLIAAKRPVATGVVKVAKKVLVEDKAVDVDLFTEKVTVNRVDLDEDADVDYAFEEGVFEIELKGEEVEVGKRVRRVGQVEVGKERHTTTQRVTGQTRREELEVNEQAYDASRPDGDTYGHVVAQHLTDKE